MALAHLSQISTKPCSAVQPSHCHYIHIIIIIIVVYILNVTSKLIIIISNDSTACMSPQVMYNNSVFVWHL